MLSYSDLTKGIFFVVVFWWPLSILLQLGVEIAQMVQRLICIETKFDPPWIKSRYFSLNYYCPSGGFWSKKFIVYMYIFDNRVVIIMVYSNEVYIYNIIVLTVY